jgi:hypothetical protein
MTLQSLLDFCAKIPECTGNVTMGRDEMWGHWAKKFGERENALDQDHGYCIQVKVSGAVYTGRGLTVEEAVEKLGEKLKAKFNNVK